MRAYQNEGWCDRVGRGLLAEILFLYGFFFATGPLSVGAFVLAAIFGVTAIVGICPLYIPLGLKTIATPERVSSLTRKAFVLAFLIAVALGGAYGSHFFTKKFFLEDYNRMNQYYKQTLFFTGQEKRPEAIENYTQLVPAYAAFRTKYTAYRPYALRQDMLFVKDLGRVSDLIASVSERVTSGDLKSAHVELEAVRPIFQDIFKRNSFSLLAVALVDFHDAMEEIITKSDAKDDQGVLAVYPGVSEKLSAVEAEANDAEIKAIRSSIETLRTMAESGKTEELSAQAATLKSSFVKVYLKRG